MKKVLDEVLEISDKDIQEEMVKEDPATPAKEKLEKRKTIHRKKASFLKKLMWITVGWILLFIVFAIVVVKSIWDDRIHGDEFLYGNCTTDVGEVSVEGRRNFIRPFTQVAGMRYYNPNKLSEQIMIENHHPGLISVSMTGDESKVVIFGEALGVDVEIPIGEKYLFVYQEDSVMVNHTDLCH